MDIIRTAESRFEGLSGYAFEPHYLTWRGLRVHHLDEGEPDRPVVLLLHGEPTWCYIYRKWIGPLVDAGYRVIAPDHIGFGRSDKPTDDAWYVIERHCERLRHLIDTLDLRRITLVVQDWGGPIGLRQLCDQPGRFERVMIHNTWLHHPAYPYSETLRRWRDLGTDPNALGGDMPTGQLVAQMLRRPGHDLDAVQLAYDRPFDGEASKAGARRFPWCLPFAQPEAGNATDQARCRALLPTLGVPVHVAFGDSDPIFTIEHALRWHAELPGSTFDVIEQAGHFVQEDAPDDCLELILRHGRTRAHR